MIPKKTADYRERQKSLNRKRKDYYLTDNEHSYLAGKLKEFRLRYGN